VKLTAAGEALVPEARALVEGEARAREAARSAHFGEAGRLRVGFVNPAMDAVLSGALLALRRERPLLELELREMDSVSQLAALRAGTLHVGFVRHGWLDMSGLETLVVVRESYVLALPEGHPLAKEERVPLGALDGAGLIMYPRSSQPRLYDAMMAAFREAGVTPKVSQEALSKFTTLSLVAAGLGVALLPRSAMVWSRGGVVFREVEGELPEVAMAAAWSRTSHRAAGRLAALCLK